MNLNKLNYPMFNITLNEAFILVEARKKLTLNKGLCYALCQTARIYRSDSINASRLGEKLMGALSGSHWLGVYMRRLHNCSFTPEECLKMRKIWIKKLLAYNGY